MRKSLKKEYELDRTYDFAEAKEHNRNNNRGLSKFIKKRAHKRYRKSYKSNIISIIKKGEIKSCIV